MAIEQKYDHQIRLLISILSFINKEKVFALKGGTAINLFVRDLPRLSVDIDLVYLPINSREIAIKECCDSLSRIAKNIQQKLLNIKVFESFQNKKDALRLVAFENKISVKIELSPVLRGVIYPTEWKSVHAKVAEKIGFAEMNIVSFEDLFAGKICAALDRQHPRDLFDVKILLENEGVSEKLRKAFIVYLISHPRPIHEVLKPRLKPLIESFTNEFDGMTLQKVSIHELEETRINLIQLMPKILTKEEKNFIFSIYQSNPRWELLGLKNIEKLPAVRWKLLNVNKMSDEKRRKEVDQISEILEKT